MQISCTPSLPAGTVFGVATHPDSIALPLVETPQPIQALPPVPSPPQDDALARVERAMMRLSWTLAKAKKGTRRGPNEDTLAHLAHALVVDAVDEGPGDGCHEVTVGTVADRLAVDPSHASRLVAATIKAGFVVRVASQDDGRRSRLELTELGANMAAWGHQFRHRIFGSVMAAWTDSERADFSRLLSRFTEGLARVWEHPPGPSGIGPACLDPHAGGLAAPTAEP
jgi:DNA-binding MarR family transcriptional regulator